MNLDDVVCNCLGVTGNDIKTAVENGAATYEEVQEKTEAGTVCGACEEEIKSLIKEFAK